MEPDSEWKVEQGHSIVCWGQGQSDCVCHGPSVEVPRVASSPPSPLCPSLSPGAGRLPPRIPGRGGWPPARVALPAWTSLEVLSLLSGAQRMELSLGAGPAAPGVAARYGLASGGHPVNEGYWYLDHPSPTWVIFPLPYSPLPYKTGPAPFGSEPRGSLECNPEIPAFPGEEY